MASVVISNNNELIERIQSAVATLFKSPFIDLERGSENHSQYSCKFNFRQINSFRQLISNLATFSDIYTLTVEIQIQVGRATIIIKDGDWLVDQSWEEDDALTPAPISEEANYDYSKLKDLLITSGMVCNGELILSCLESLEVYQADTSISLHVYIDKTALIKKLNWPTGIRVILYLLSNKLTESLDKFDFYEINNLFTPNSEEMILILLGDIFGSASGPCLKIYGRDTWLNINIEKIMRDFDTNKIKEIVQFREQECHWELNPFTITPFHFHINRLESQLLDKVNDAFGKIKNRLCIAFIANRTSLINKDYLQCEFEGYKRIKISLEPSSGELTTNTLYELFIWGYQSFSSDKIDILRQIISLQLGENPRSNFSRLIELSENILISAKSNFHLFLKGNVDRYFEKREQVSEYLQKITEDINKNISDITLELVNNIYKTIGVIIGILIAALVKPISTPVIIRMASFLYFIYILFILLFLLPSSYVIFGGIVKKYEFNKVRLQDILLKEEINNLEGPFFIKSKRNLKLTFVLAIIFYEMLAGFSIFIFWAFP
jgi:hypothetical protein